MPQAFQARKFFIPKTDPKQEVYKPVPYYFGTLSTQDAADQIAEESSLTKGDVLNVLDRYQRYVIKNLQKGYKVELLGFGTVYNRFVTEKGVATAPEVKATHIRTIVPGFSPSYTILNGATVLAAGREDFVAQGDDTRGARWRKAVPILSRLMRSDVTFGLTQK